MAILAVTTVTRAGVDTAGVAASGGGDKFANTGQEFVEVKNGGGAPITVTLDIQATIDGAPAVDPTPTVAAGQTKIFGPFPPGIYNDANGYMNLGYSGVTSVTVKPFKCPPT